MCLRCGALIKAIDAYLAKADDDLSDALGDEGYINPSGTVNAMSDLEEKVAAALTEETEYILGEAEQAIDLETFAQKIWPGVKLNDTLKEKLLTIFREKFAELVPQFAEAYLASFEEGLKIRAMSKRTTAWVDSWSEELAEIMQLNSHKQIEAILDKGLEEKFSIAEFSRAIKNSGIRDEYYKARRVAVTEVLTAHRAAQQEAFLQSPATSEKMWRHTGIFINEPRQNHKDMDGQRVPKAEPYELKGVRGGTFCPQFPGDPLLPPEERIECHCISQGIVSEEVLGLPLEERQRLQQEAIDELDAKWEADLEAKYKAMVGFEDK